MSNLHNISDLQMVLA